jgi:hypothetical protein
VCQELPFDPFPFLDDPNQQTILSSMFNLQIEPLSERKLVTLPDGDRISLEVTTPKGWEPADRTVLMVHGLCGSHRSPNLVRMAKKLETLGVRAIRFNMRGCGSGRGLAKQIYHSGRSEDVFEAVKKVKEEHPDSPLTVIGFSLGGNLVLKMAGELSSLGTLFIDQVIAVSPPVDLFSSIVMFGEPRNALYERYFYRMLRKDVHYLHGKFRDLPRIRLPRYLKLYEFDQVYTAPRCGFSSAKDYYNKCSAVGLVSEIATPTKILLSEDDPIVSSSSLDGLWTPSNVEVFKTKKGGHMGYLGNPASGKGFYWLDSVLSEWIQGN